VELRPPSQLARPGPQAYLLHHAGSVTADTSNGDRALPQSGGPETQLIDLGGRIALRPREVAAVLGVALRTVESWIADGRLPASKQGRIVLISLVDLHSFLESRRLRRTPAEPRGLRAKALSIIEGASQDRQKR
jgi:excisionase family DNA binding protein